MTISELIDESGAQVRIFDLGRRIQKIGRADFKQFETGDKAFPVPYLKHAWLGVLTWQPSNPDKHTIWFLKLPLDEQNLIQPADRDAFVKHWLRVIQAPDQEHGEAPCSFKPDQHRMAYFHALALSTLGLPATDYYHTARAYLAADIETNNWQSLGIQGIAETVVNLNDAGNADLIANALPAIANEPRQLWLGFLEHQTLTTALADRVGNIIEAALADQQQIISAAELSIFARAIVGMHDQQRRQQLLENMLQRPEAGDIEFITTVFSRCWQDLDDHRLLRAMELLAGTEQAIFTALIADTMTLPNMRDRILAAFRSPDRSPELMAAIGTMLSALRRTVQ